MNQSEFRARFGEPTNDDLHRANCEQAGEVGHDMCGICAAHKSPRFLCGCAAQKPEITHAARQKLAELAPELMSEFGGGRPMISERACPTAMRDAVTLEDVEGWLRSRGVVAQLELQGRILVPIKARLL